MVLNEKSSVAAFAVIPLLSHAGPVSAKKVAQKNAADNSATPPSNSAAPMLTVTPPTSAAPAGKALRHQPPHQSFATDSLLPAARPVTAIQPLMETPPAVTSLAPSCTRDNARHPFAKIQGQRCRHRSRLDA